MDGEINVESESGVGSNFWFDLPLLPTLRPDTRSESDDASSVEWSEALSGVHAAHILVAEDNPINQQVVRAMLEKLGMTVFVVEDGAQAVQAALSQPFDLVLMDCQMPTMDGYEATAEIRASANSQSKIPIIALTANVLLEDQQKCISAGMDAFLAKPVSVSDLSRLIVQHLAPNTDA